MISRDPLARTQVRSLLRDEVLPKLGGDIEKIGRAFAAKKATLKEVLATYVLFCCPAFLSTQCPSLC